MIALFNINNAINGILRILYKLDTFNMVRKTWPFLKVKNALKNEFKWETIVPSWKGVTVV